MPLRALQNTRDTRDTGPDAARRHLQAVRPGLAISGLSFVQPSLDDVFRTLKRLYQKGYEVLEQIVPAEVAVVEAFADKPDATLFPEEEAFIAKAVHKRRAEFATARACAHAALSRLGEPPAPVIPGLRGAPEWPEGVAGSITHCAGYRAAAVARTRDVVTLGVDAEPDEILPDGVLDMIASEKERAQLAGLAVTAPGVCWDRLLFSAKESVYKAWFPLTQSWLDFDQADILIDAQDGTFLARLLVPGPLVDGSPLTSLAGRWLAARGLVLTAIVVPRTRNHSSF